MSKKPDGTKNVSTRRGLGRDMPRSGPESDELAQGQPWHMQTRAQRAEHKQYLETQGIGARYRIRVYIARVIRKARSRHVDRGPVEGDFKTFYDRAVRRTRMGVIG